jgi:hypothetical protein
MLGEMLLQLKQPREALVEFRKTIVKEPNRFRGFAGAALAAEQSGDAVSARTYRQELARICEKGDRPGRPELEAARKPSGARRH